MGIGDMIKGIAPSVVAGTLVGAAISFMVYESKIPKPVAIERVDRNNDGTLDTVLKYDNGAEIVCYQKADGVVCNSYMEQ